MYQWPRTERPNCLHKFVRTSFRVCLGIIVEIGFLYLKTTIDLFERFAFNLPIIFFTDGGI